MTHTEGKQQPVRLLLVDADETSAQTLIDALHGRPIQIAQAPTIKEAHRQTQEMRFDLVLVDAQMPDGDGLELIDELNATFTPPPQSIVLSSHRKFDVAMRALRTGAGDVLIKPLKREHLMTSLDAALQRIRDEQKRQNNYKQLREACSAATDSRDDVGQQVDVLCQDLVVAYQDLANQMQQVVYASEFTAVIRQELDLEQLLRKVLEYLVEKAGPTNAAIFLPSNADEYTLGGYVNYDAVGGSPDLLLEHLADVALPALADHDGLLLLDDNQSLGEWLGDDATYLEDCNVMTITGVHDDEALAVLMLFRDGSEPFEDTAIEAMETITPLLADHLARIIRVHHRHTPEVNDEYDDLDAAA